MRPAIAIVGRPNVGKSTLFNRMTGSRRAIVAPMAGTTRDALERPVEWRGVTFNLLDTGGLYGASEDPLHDLVVRQGQRAVAGADLMVFLVDGREGLVPGDQTIARELRYQYLLGYTPAKSIERGDREWRSIRVTLKRPGMRVRARDGYMTE